VLAIDDRFRSVRLAAVWALEELGREAISSLSAVTRLAHLLEQEEDPYVTYAAYWALGWQGGSATNAQRAAFRASDRGRAAWRAVAGC
jgi:HEAT repeat protein